MNEKEIRDNPSEEEDPTEERSKYKIPESLPDDLIQERNDDRETDPCYDPKQLPLQNLTRQRT